MSNPADPPATADAATDGGDDAWTVRRIVVALDASAASAAAAAGAARIAARLSAGLHGLFVEDAALLRVAGLPGCVEIGTFSASRRSLSGAEVERRLRAQAARARRLLAASALAAAVEDHRFEVLRGEVRQTLAEAVGDADLLSLGRVGTSGLTRLGSVARGALAGRRGHLLLLPAGGRIEPPLVAVYGESAAARRALRAALDLFDRRQADRPAPRSGSLTVLVVTEGGEPEVAERLEAEAGAVIAAGGHSPALARFRRVLPGDHHALSLTVARSRANVLLLPADSPLVRSEDLESVVAGLDCSVLLVR
ncbi:MAG TPA: hypothetical protein VM617_05770 [Thermoanaerobaculia bacterium]|nr:hypothetical protein [Thermoanaerobaculia bacterium]